MEANPRIGMVMITEFIKYMGSILSTEEIPSYILAKLQIKLFLLALNNIKDGG
jgi:hypothetical protein